MTLRKAALVSLALLAACNPKGPSATEQSATPSPSPTLPSFIVSAKGNSAHRVRFVAEGKHNRRDYEMLVRSYRSNGPTGSTQLAFNQVHITFFAKDGATMVADAPAATADQATNIVELMGGVHGTSSTGTMLTCDTLTYDRAKQTVHGIGHVVITTKTGFRATGNRFDSDVSLTHTSMR